MANSGKWMGARNREPAMQGLRSGRSANRHRTCLHDGSRFLIVPLTLMRGRLEFVFTLKHFICHNNQSGVWITAIGFVGGICWTVCPADCPGGLVPVDLVNEQRLPRAN